MDSRSACYALSQIAGFLELAGENRFKIRAYQLAARRLMARGATAEEMAEAQAWITNDEPLVNTGKPLPKGRVGALAEILMTLEDESDEPPR